LPGWDLPRFLNDSRAFAHSRRAWENPGKIQPLICRDSSMIPGHLPDLPDGKIDGKIQLWICPFDLPRFPNDYGAFAGFALDLPKLSAWYGPRRGPTANARSAELSLGQALDADGMCLA
jgi:hypothetical protein